MPVLTPEQKKLWAQRKKELYPGDTLDILSADNSIHTWWSSVTDELSKKMTKINQEQGVSMVESHTIWIG